MASWKPEEVEHLKKRFAEKAAPDVIAKELNEQFNKNSNTFAVKKMLTHLKLTQGTRKPKNNGSEIRPDGRKISQGEYLTRRTNSLRKQMGRDETQPVGNVLTTLKKDQVAFCPGLGPVVSTGEQEIYGSRMIGLRETFARSAQIKTIYVHSNDFGSKNVRPLHTKQELDAAITFMERGQPTKKLPRRMDQRKAYFEILLQSGNIYELAEIIVRAYRIPRETGTPIAGTDADKAEMAIHMLAAEYASVSKKTYKQAEELINSKSGKKNLQELGKIIDTELSPG